MKIYEVFLKKPGKDPFEHAGSLEAPDDEMALVLARETYVRRHEGDAIWLVERTNIIEAGDEYLAVNADKEYRFNDGSRVAERRRRRREGQE